MSTVGALLRSKTLSPSCLVSPSVDVQQGDGHEQSLFAFCLFTASGNDDVKFWEIRFRRESPFLRQSP